MNDAAPTSCEACAAWLADNRSGRYEERCAQCRARSIARSPAAWRADRGESDVELREAIARNFGDGNEDRGRKLVWAWIKRLKDGRKP